MSDLDELFGGKAQPEPHPTARTWLERLERGQKATVEVVRKREGLSYRPTKIYIRFETPNGAEVQHDDWDPHLNDVLSGQKVKACTDENEALRLSLMFEEWFRYPAQEYGDDYFNAVLVEYVKSSGFKAFPAVVSILRDVSENVPSQDSTAYSACRVAIKTILAKGAQLLTELGYERAKAETILAQALTQYLDDRFNVTNRRMLGFR